MIGKKTRQQQRQIIEKRVDTSNAGKDFDPRPYLDAAKHPHQEIAESPKPRAEAKEDDDPTPRGENQESRHHKHSGTPEDQAEG